MARKPRRARERTGTISAAPEIREPWILNWVVYPVLILLPVVFCCVRPIADLDVWFHMALGREVLNTGHIPKTDIFSFTAYGQEWISSGWLSSVLYELLFRWIGPGGGGVLLLVTIIVAASLLVPYAYAQWKYRAGGVLTPVLLLAILGSYLRYTPRPDVWSPLMLGLLLLILSVMDDPGSGNRKWLAWTLVPLMGLWANLHAGFMAGVIVLGIFCAPRALAFVRERKRGDLLLLVPCAIAAIAWVANPYGIRILALAGKIRAIPGYRQFLYEWMPIVSAPHFNMPWPAYAGLVGLVVLGGILLIPRAREVPLWRWGVLGFLIVFACWQRRQIGLLAVGLPVVILPFVKPFPHRLVAPVASAVLALTICGMQFNGTLQAGIGWPSTGREARSLPCLGTDFYEMHTPPGRMCNTYGGGGYLLYHLYPKTKVYIDGRLDVYPTQVWLDYLAIDEGRMTVQDFCARYGTNHFFIESKGAEGEPRHLAARLARMPDWALVYFDDDYSIFVHNEAATAEYVRQFAFQYANPFATERLTRALAAEGTREAALGEIQRALELSSGSANANVLAALTARLFRDEGAAAQHLQAALARAPENPLLRKMLNSR